MANPLYGQNKFDNAADHEMAVPQSLKGLTITTKNTGASVTFVYGININNVVGNSTAQTVTLPAAKAGKICIHAQALDTTGGTNTHAWDCAGDDVFAPGSVVESRNSSAVVYDTSVSGETKLNYTPANATTNLFTIVSRIMFYCIKDGEWEIATSFAQDPLAVTGAFAFAS